MEWTVCVVLFGFFVNIMLLRLSPVPVTMARSVWLSLILVVTFTWKVSFLIIQLTPGFLI